MIGNRYVTDCRAGIKTGLHVQHTSRPQSETQFYYIKCEKTMLFFYLKYFFGSFRFLPVSPGRNYFFRTEESQFKPSEKNCQPWRVCMLVFIVVHTSLLPFQHGLVIDKGRPTCVLCSRDVFERVSATWLCARWCLLAEGYHRNSPSAIIMIDCMCN